MPYFKESNRLFMSPPLAKQAQENYLIIIL